MKLSELFENYKGIDVEISGISINSKEVKPGDLFLCIKGKTVDRHDFIDDAVAHGAVALVTEHEVETTVPYVMVDDLNSKEIAIYRKFYHNPQDELTIIGVTGTDGKTSTTTIIQTLIGKDKCGYIGTNGYSCAAFKKDTQNTTPAPDKLYSYFREFRDNGCSFVAMEASSEGFFYGRMNGIDFKSGVITNIDSEHLNTHKTLENYIDCKKQLFRQTSGFSVLNRNDKHYEDVLDAVGQYKTYGYDEQCDLFIKRVEVFPDHTDIDFSYDNKDYSIESPLLGKFNVENLMAALLSCLSLGLKMEDLLANVKDLCIDGRMMSIRKGQDFYVVVDYAHTPNGLRRLFEFTQILDINDLIIVSGQAGERDPYKRKTVGELIARNCEHAIFTYEDPRSEDINTIIDMMCENIQDLSNYERVIDRHEAIEKAISIAKKKDMVMVLGKGNETYQKLKEGKIYFNDVEECISAIDKRLKGEL